jgi:hypothetical protein
MMEFWRHIEAFFDILLTRNVMTEITTVAVCLYIGWRCSSWSSRTAYSSPRISTSP